MKDNQYLFEVVDSEEFKLFRENIISSCLEVLSRLNNEGFFKENNQQLQFINFHVPGDGCYWLENKMIKTFSKLNKGEIVEEFKQNIREFK